MAQRPLSESYLDSNLKADLPEHWNNDQYLSAGGTEVGLERIYGYNYLSTQINNAQRAIKNINQAFDVLGSIETQEFLVSDEATAQSRSASNPGNTYYTVVRT